jgi:ribulose kinase
MAENADILSPAEMREWLQREVTHVMKEAELRIADAADFVTAYATGKLSPQEASERMKRYDNRWGEATLLGIMSEQGMTNEEILRRLDEDRALREKDWRTHFRGGEGSKEQGR